ncbi:hypothetical protein PR202_ga22316 [Eleusine coracana subsp. coracana]|uniref:Uncharacterized protein n=1 Tax=Eleusine coracana subsp. coracana TaxID=191504 RepID=A0AAV5D396_ELECO|nr:hypothetical protein QOZ80_9AG0687100 [Eleusine coracana subsp. coracana]GJN04744.1 hypothetical protein PR202_ga22316 [Eleusine coracana subsp. coracana]
MTTECARSVPALTEILSSLRKTTRLVAFVTDMFGIDSFDAASRAGVARRCLFMPVNLHTLSLFLYLPALAASSIPGGFKDLAPAEPVRLPGCVPIPGPEIIPQLQDRSGPGFWGIVHLAERCRVGVDAILVNTFDAVEPEVAKLLRQPEPGRPPVYPIGPLVMLTTSDNNSNNGTARNRICLEWLNRQSPSGQRFLWVVRSPSDDSTPSEYYFDAESRKDPFRYLPEGFLDRTKDTGLVVQSWAPQTEVLAHSATGGFLTPCGWNSALESLVHGVPMLAWPLFAEQGQNAMMLAEEGVQAALRLPGMKDKETIAAMVRELMEGEGKGATVRKKVAQLQKAAKESLRDGGASMTALDELVLEWAAGTNE